jgi:hypothetical protein
MACDEWKRSRSEEVCKGHMVKSHGTDQGFGNLARDGEGFGEGDGSGGDALGEGGAFHQLHDEVVRAYLEEGADVGVVEGGDAAGFALEVLGELLGGDFDGDDAVEAGVARALHLSHSARAKGRDDLVGSEFTAGRKRHGRVLTSLRELAQTVAVQMQLTAPRACPAEGPFAFPPSG